MGHFSLDFKKAKGSSDAMLPSLTSGCRGSVHPGVRGGNMGMSGNKSALPDNQNHPVLPIL